MLLGLLGNQCQDVVARNHFVVLVVNLDVPDHHTLRMSVRRCPTLINLAGGSLEQPLPIDGLDIWPVVTEGALSPRNEFIWSPQVIRRDGWKLIDQGGLYYPHAKKAQELDTPSEAQLYHISEDPHEETNLIDQQPEIVASLRQRLAEIKSQIRPAGPVEKIPKDARIYGKEEAQTFQGWDQ